MNITILNELKNFIPPLSPQEFKDLEKNIIQNGCLDPLKVWKVDEKFILIDGHNRYEICQKHNITFGIEKMQFDNIAQVKIFMLEFQKSRRNINSLTRSFLIGEEYNLIISTNKKRENTAEYLAKKHQESEPTIKRYAKLATQINEMQAIKKYILQENISFKDVEILHQEKDKLIIDSYVRENGVKKLIQEAKDQAKGKAPQPFKILDKYQNDTLKEEKYFDNGLSNLPILKIKELVEKGFDCYKSEMENVYKDISERKFSIKRFYLPALSWLPFAEYPNQTQMQKAGAALQREDNKIFFSFR